MKVGFLFIHEGRHQVAHSLPTALRLSMLRPDIEVEIFLTPGEVDAEAALVASETPHRCTFIFLRTESKVARLAERLIGNSAPVARLALLRENIDRFRHLEALVVPEKTSLLLKTRFGLSQLKMIHTRHGAGDRAIGFDRATGLFDFMLLPGRKVRDRLDDAGLLKPDNHAIVGYPKFDLVHDRSEQPRLFQNGRPTVLYNPHPSPHLSSWYKMGRQILNYFAGSLTYNLIFAPHVMLFKRRTAIAVDRFSFARVGRVPVEHRQRRHMLIDTGSAASVDMTYALAADIYLGDASSQIYEFLVRPRPCLFANPHRIEWAGDPNFAHWRAGPVFDSIRDLPDALSKAVNNHPVYATVQREMFDYTFDLTATPSSERAAIAIADFLDGAAR